MTSTREGVFVDGTWMGLYARYLLPRIIDLTCGSKPVRKQREKIVPLAAGRVLEVGIDATRAEDDFR